VPVGLRLAEAESTVLVPVAVAAGAPALVLVLIPLMVVGTALDADRVEDPGMPLILEEVMLKVLDWARMPLGLPDWSVPIRSTVQLLPMGKPPLGAWTLKVCRAVLTLAASSVWIFWVGSTITTRNVVGSELTDVQVRVLGPAALQVEPCEGKVTEMARAEATKERAEKAVRIVNGGIEY